MADENVTPAHVSALLSAGHDVVRVSEEIEEGASDRQVLDAGRDANRVVLTYDRKDFARSTDHAGVFVTAARMPPPDVRRAVERIDTAYPSLEDVVEFLSDWA